MVAEPVSADTGAGLFCFHSPCFAAAQADAKPIESCLSEGSIGMSRAIIEAIASGSVITVVDVMRFVKCTLLAATSDFQASTSASNSLHTTPLTGHEHSKPHWYHSISHTGTHHTPLLPRHHWCMMYSKCTSAKLPLISCNHIWSYLILCGLT